MKSWEKIGISLIFLIALVIFLFFPQKVFAGVVINEVLPNPSGNEEAVGEWVELYNTDESPIDVSGYRLKDAANHELIIDVSYTGGNTTINGHSWLVVERNNHLFPLNNDTETINLYNNSTESAQLLNSFTYENTSEDKSWGRIPDGTGGIHASVLDPTPGSANQAPQSTATPTLSPTNTPVSTLTPTSSPTPTPTKKPTPTLTLAPTLEISPSEDILLASDNLPTTTINNDEG